MTTSSTQEQTKDAFGFKWTQRHLYESPSMQKQHLSWMLQRYCAGDENQISRWLDGSPKTILDAGCGVGWSGQLFFDQFLHRHHYVGVDIAQQAIEVARERFRERGLPGEFIQSDLMAVPLPNESVDLIFSEGVLHHTDNTEAAIKCLSQKLKTDGLFLFYVYAKKAVIREFTDDHIRQELQGMPPEKAWEALLPLSKLGKALGELNVTLDVPEDIPYLGIKKGEMDLQRFFYWNICKAFYRENYTLEEMNHTNFDWFSPLNCHRHSPEEIQEYCEKAELKILHQDIQESGITVVARKIG